MSGPRKITDQTDAAPHPVAANAEMLRAAGDVIAARLGIIATGMSDPGRADLGEMSLMGVEKVEALTASTAAVVRGLGEMGDALGRSALTEMGHASRTAARMASAGDPMAAAGLQFHYALGWWSRAGAQAMSLNAALNRVQTEALAPIHTTAVANALRLRRREGGA